MRLNREQMKLKTPTFLRQKERNLTNVSMFFIFLHLSIYIFFLELKVEFWVFNTFLYLFTWCVYFKSSMPLQKTVSYTGVNIGLTEASVTQISHLPFSACQERSNPSMSWSDRSWHWGQTSLFCHQCWCCSLELSCGSELDLVLSVYLPLRHTSPQHDALHHYRNDTS